MNEDTRTAPAGSLRLLWPQWQGAGPDAVAALAADLPSPLAHTGYALGTRILDLLVPDNSPRQVLALQDLLGTIEFPA